MQYDAVRRLSSFLSQNTPIPEKLIVMLIGVVI